MGFDRDGLIGSGWRSIMEHGRSAEEEEEEEEEGFLCPAMATIIS